MMASLLTVTLLSGAPPPAPGQDAAKARMVDLGKERYVQYCASCHGMKGKGDGILAEAMRVAMPDLTQISTRRKGQFPEAEVAEIIDGRKYILSHGTSQMPVWGERLGQESHGNRESNREPLIHTRIATLVAYLKSIQEVAK